MTEYRYRLATDFPPEVIAIYRETRDDNGLSYHVWNRAKKEWIPNGDAAGTFVGFEPSRPISEEEVNGMVKKMADESFCVIRGIHDIRRERYSRAYETRFNLEFNIHASEKNLIRRRQITH